MVLGGIPERVEFFQRAIFETFASLVNGALDLLETFDKFVGRPVEQIFRVEFFEPGKIDGGEK